MGPVWPFVRRGDLPGPSGWFNRDVLFQPVQLCRTSWGTTSVSTSQIVTNISTDTVLLGQS